MSITFNFLGLIKINCHLDWNPHLNSIGIKVARVIGLLRKLNYDNAPNTSVVNYLELNHIATYALCTFSVGNEMP